MLDATRPGTRCIQRDFFQYQENLTGQEDCLYLNVFTSRTDYPLEEVMVYIHGGGWVMGSGVDHDPRNLLDKDIVLVTFNYRLGALGFLSTGDRSCPGNNGLKDQVAALRWIRDNIAAFGGNPGSVTIFGEDAGGASVHYHLLSSASKGLFHRAISQSGTAFCPWALAPYSVASENVIKLGKLLHCPTTYSVELVNCLRRRDASEIVKKDKEFMDWSIDPLIPFRPVVEITLNTDTFILAPPLHLLKFSSTVHHVPWMVGINSEEGALAASRIYGKNLTLDFDMQFNKLAPMMLYYRETSKLYGRITAALRKFYFGEGYINNDTAFQMVDLFTDGWFLHGTNEAVKIHARKHTAPIYYYYFSYRGSRSFSSLFGDSVRNYGVSHRDELLYLFPSNRTFPNAPTTPDDEKMVDLMTSLWTNFAKYGNPAAKDEVRWNPVGCDSIPDVAILDATGVHTGRGLLQGRTKLWSSLPLH